MRQQTIDIIRDYLTLALAGLGISFAPHEYFGGLFLALAAGSLIARHRRSNKRFTGILATSGIVATIALIAAQEFEGLNVAPQLIMATAGGLSGWIVNITVKMMDEAEERSERILDRLIDRLLPGRRK